MSDFAKHDAHNRQNIEIDDNVNLVLVVVIFVFDVRMMFFVAVIIVVVFSSAFIVSIVFFLVELISISLEIELLATFACRVKLFFAENALFDDDDDDILDFWLSVWLNFIEKRESQNENDDDYDERWLLRDKAIDADIQKSIDRVINVSKRIRFVRHDFVNLSVMFSILLELRIETQMKVQNEKIVIDRHVDDHFSNVLHCRFKSSNVIRDVLIVDENDASELDQQIV